jgi:hypothetical protein
VRAFGPGWMKPGIECSSQLCDANESKAASCRRIQNIVFLPRCTPCLWSFSLCAGLIFWSNWPQSRSTLLSPIHLLFSLADAGLKSQLSITKVGAETRQGRSPLARSSLLSNDSFALCLHPVEFVCDNGSALLLLLTGSADVRSPKCHQTRTHAPIKKVTREYFAAAVSR